VEPSTEKAAPPPVQLDHHQAWLLGRVSGRRFQHSVGAQIRALDLSDKFGLSPEDRKKIALASLLHDAAKEMSPEDLLRYCDDNNLPLTPIERDTTQTIHPVVGAHQVKQLLNVDDEETLNAIRFHTTGRAGMSRVEKVVYLADKLEGNTRNPLFVQKVMSFVDPKRPESLDKALLFLLDSTISFLMEKQQVIHTHTIEARNDLLLALRPVAAPAK
jgi:predicted HD superfamily hydrolase involved in NAD metabolism